MISAFLTYFALRGALAAPFSILADECTREVLRAHTEAYIAAQTSGNPSALVSIASPSLNYTEDFAARNLSTGSVLTTPLKIDLHRSLLDTTQCATYTELIASDPSLPRVIGTQMRFDPTGKSLVKMESLVTQPGDWAFNATLTLQYAQREVGLWNFIAEDERDTRETIQKAADAYLDLFNDKGVEVPWGTPCNRLEGSWYTGNGSLTDSCDVGVPDGVPITQRRYVIDEVLGAVDTFVVFGTGGRPDSHEFRVENGRLRFVHTLTVMRNVTGLTA